MDDWRPQTWAVRAQVEESQHHEHSVPMFLTSSFVFEDSEEMRAAFAGEIDRNIYGRFTNPNVEELSEKIRRLEGAEAGHSLATGMAAVFAAIDAAATSVGFPIRNMHTISESGHTGDVLASIHGIVAAVLSFVIIAHIYIGSIGREGAFDAMGSGEVDLNWAKEHHSLWVEEVQAKSGDKSIPTKGAHPAE